MGRTSSRAEREALRALAGRFHLPADAPDRLEGLLLALAAEANPPTTLRAPAEALDGHLADSLVALEVPAVREARRIADVGAGAGFPGLALAIALPAASIDLIEPARRKCAVIDRLIATAALENARAVIGRAETWAGEEGSEAYDLVTARAVGGLATVAEYAAPLLKPGGALVAWKGRRDQEEERGGAVAAERLGLDVSAVRRVAPFTAARHRHLHVFEKVAPTPTGIPRRPGMAAKRPLG